MLTKYLTTQILQDLQDGKLRKSEAMELFREMESRETDPQATPLPAKSENGNTTRDGLRRRLLEDLLEEIRDILNFGSQRIDPEVKFNEHGFNSLTFTEFANRINERLGTELTPADFFAHQNSEALVSHLLESYMDPIAEFYAPDQGSAAGTAGSANG